MKGLVWWISCGNCDIAATVTSLRQIALSKRFVFLQRRQRQARRFAKWLKQRQRKENRQQLKEQRSGLFINEEKVKIERESEEVEIDV